MAGVEKTWRRARKEEKQGGWAEAGEPNLKLEARRMRRAVPATLRHTGVTPLLLGRRP